MLDTKLKKAISQTQVKVMPLVTNAGFKQSVMHNLLLSPTAQGRVIKSLVAVAKLDKYIGWQFDFENISYWIKIYIGFCGKNRRIFA